MVYYLFKHLLQRLWGKLNRFCAHATEADIEKVIKDWLRYSIDRDGGRKRRTEKRKKMPELRPRLMNQTEKQRVINTPFHK